MRPESSLSGMPLKAPFHYIMQASNHCSVIYSSLRMLFLYFVFVGKFCVLFITSLREQFFIDFHWLFVRNNLQFLYLRVAESLQIVLF